MDSMIEKVARAIWNDPAKCDLRNVTTGPCTLEEECTCWPVMKEVARAAIEAMREPTEAMMMAMCEIDCTRDRCAAQLKCKLIEKTGSLQVDRLNAAIDAALQGQANDRR